MARIFGMGFFGVKVWSRDFWGVLIFAPFYHPCHVESRVPPSPGSGGAGLGHVPGNSWLGCAVGLATSCR